MSRKNRVRSKLTVITLKHREIKIYSSPKLAEALEEVSGDLSLYKGVRLAQILESVYLQGRKDGARETFESLDKSFREVQKIIPHKLPGRPRRKK